MSKYPAQIDTIISLPKVADNNSSITGDYINRLRDAIVATETEMGIKPSGTYSTVRARLDAFDALLAGLINSGLSGDASGHFNNTKVIGLAGRPLSDAAPTLSQVIAWNGIAWAPSSVAGGGDINILPSNITLPIDICFLAGDGYVVLSSPSRLGAREIDMASYPVSYPDGRTQILKFVADIQVTNAATDGYVQLKDVTHNTVIFNSLIHTNLTGINEFSKIITAATVDGYIRTECCDPTMYEIQAWVTGGNGTTDQVIVSNARIQVVYSNPILISALAPLALPNDINFIAGTELNGFDTPATMASRQIDMSFYPGALPDGRSRVVKFVYDAEVSAPGVTGFIQLYDATNGVVVAGTNLSFTNTVVDESSASLTVGSVSGNLRNDFSTRYEVRAWKSSGSVSDRVIINNVRITVTYPPA